MRPAAAAALVLAALLAGPAQASPPPAEIGGCGVDTAASWSASCKAVMTSARLELYCSTSGTAPSEATASWGITTITVGCTNNGWWGRCDWTVPPGALVTLTLSQSSGSGSASAFIASEAADPLNDNCQ